MERDFIFWNMIEQRAYISDNDRLNEGSWARFVEKEIDKSVYIFGCSEASSLAADLLKDHFTIVGFLDNAEEKQGGVFEGMPVYAPVEIVPELNSDRDVILIVMRRSSDAVAAQLEGLGFTNIYSMGVLLGGMDPYRALINRIEEARMRPLEDIIMFESTNDVDGNSGALYRYLKNKGSNHRFVWVLKRESSKCLLDGTGDIGLSSRDNLDDYMEYIYYLNIAKWQIWDNLPIPKMRSDQINVFLQHTGMGYKLVTKYYTAPTYVDYLLSVNEFVYDKVNRSLQFSPDTKVIFGGLPRNDVLFSGEWHELETLTKEKYDKVVMWAPTFRQIANSERNDSEREYPFGISIVYDPKDMSDLNRYLQEVNMLLLIKLHPVQKKNYHTGDYSNILYIDGDKAKQVDTYKLMTQVDAMISDYSSIVFDYMLLDRPIAWALDDLSDFKLDFLMDDPMHFMPGEKLYNMNDLLNFLKHVRDNIDIYKEERNKVSIECNACNGRSGCETVAKALRL